MLYYGTHITQANDQLNPIRFESFHRAIQSPKDELRDRIVQLRAIRSFDAQKYSQMKRMLPYVVCACFHPAVRRKSNFVFVEHFILDIDHISEAGLDTAELKEALSTDEHVRSIFVSPGGDGLKVLFSLSTPCKDEALFSSFYKLFAHQFSQQHNIKGLVDTRTHDVSRACFFSYDPNLFRRENPVKLEIRKLIPDLDFSNDLQKEIKEIEKSEATSKTKQEVDSEVLQHIKERLGSRIRSKEKKQYYVPEEVDDMVKILAENMPQYGLSIAEHQAIQYGRKLKVKALGKTIWCEVNIFYGKKGYTLVPTTKTGSNAELAQLCAELINQLITEANQL